MCGGCLSYSRCIVEPPRVVVFFLSFYSLAFSVRFHGKKKQIKKAVIERDEKRKRYKRTAGWVDGNTNNNENRRGRERETKENKKKKSYCTTIFEVEVRIPTFCLYCCYVLCRACTGSAIFTPTDSSNERANL